MSIPMIFHLDTVLWFNDYYVTSDVPEAKDLETPLEVGSWAWNWMEPPLGILKYYFFVFIRLNELFSSLYVILQKSNVEFKLETFYRMDKR
jgi:hypothetical protein